MDSRRKKIREEDREEIRKSIANRELLLAVGDHHVDFQKVRDLVKKADVNFQDVNGNSCLHWAAWGGNNNVINILLGRSNIKISVENSNNETALDVAWKTRPDELVLKTLSNKILAKATKIVSDHDAYRSQKLKCRSKTLFYEATASGDYDFEYRVEDMESILDFYFPSWQDNTAPEPDVYITFQTRMDRTIRLVCNKGGTYYCASWQEWSWNKDWSDKDLMTEVTEDETKTLLAIKKISDSLTQIRGKNVRVTVQKLKDFLKRQEKSEDINVDGRKFFANVLNEVRRTKSKIKSCVRLLESGPCPMDYRGANIFICFLETFAVRDVFPAVFVGIEAEKYLKERKKEYFRRLFPAVGADQSGEFYHAIIDDLRSTLFKGQREFLVTYDSINNFISEHMEGKVELFYKHLHQFAEFVSNGCSQGCSSKLGRPEANSTSTEVEEFFKKLQELKKYFVTSEVEPKDDAASVSEDVQRVFYTFCENIGKLEESPEILHQVMFDLFINIYPQLNKDKKLNHQLRLLRNKIIHGFENLTPDKLKREIPSAVHDSYRFHLAHEVHNIFTVLRHDSCRSSVRKEMADALKKIDRNYENFNYKQIGENHKGVFLPHNYDSSWMEENMDEVIKVYVTCLAPLIDRHSMGEQESTLCSEFFELNSVQKRELFEQIWYLMKQSDGQDSPAYGKRHEHLRQHIQKKLQLEEETVNYVMTVVAKGDSYNHNFNEGITEEIRQIYKTLDGLNRDYDLKKLNLSRHDVALFYEKFLNDDLEYCDLAEKEREIIMDKFRSFPNTENRQVRFGTSNVTVQISSIILNLLKMSHEVHTVYKLKVENIESAFSDDTFVTYLAKNHVTAGPKGSLTLTHPFQTANILREIEDVKFTSSFVAKLLTITKEMNVIKKTALESLVENILRGHADISYLQALIDTDCAEVSKAVYEVVKARNISEDRIREILKILVQSKSFENSVKFFEDEKLIKLLLLSANDVFSKFVNEGNRKEARRVLDQIIKFLEQEATQKDMELMSEWKLSKAKFFNQIADKESHFSGKKNSYESSLEELKYIVRDQPSSKEERPRHYMLALARTAFTYVQQSKWTDNKLELLKKSLDIQNELWIVLWHYITSDNGDPPDLEKFFRRAEKSIEYHKLLKSSEDCKKYISVPKIRSSILHAEFLIARQSEDLAMLQKVLVKYNDLYSFWKGKIDNGYAERAMSLILYKKTAIYGIMTGLSTDRSKNYYQLKNIELTILLYLKICKLSGSRSSEAKNCIESLRSLRKSIIQC